MFLVGVGRQAHVFIAAGGVAFPHFLTVGQVVGRYSAARCEFIAAEADDDFVIRDKRCPREGLAMIRVSVLDDPDFLAGDTIEGDDVTVQGAEHEFPVRVRQTTIHGIATGTRHR